MSIFSPNQRTFLVLFFQISFLYKNILLLFYYKCANYQPFSILSSAQSSPRSHSQSPHCCPCLWVIYTYSLNSPFSTLHHYSPPPSPLDTFRLFYVSMPLVLLCSLDCFFHQVHLIVDSIWYISFINWLISFSTILSSSIHTDAKGRSSFFLSDVQYSLVHHSIFYPLIY